MLKILPDLTVLREQVVSINICQVSPRRLECALAQFFPSDSHGETSKGCPTQSLMPRNLSRHFPLCHIPPRRARLLQRPPLDHHRKNDAPGRYLTEVYEVPLRSTENRLLHESHLARRELYNMDDWPSADVSGSARNPPRVQRCRSVPNTQCDWLV